MSGSQAIRVAIVDDHQIVRSGLALILSVEPDIKLVAEAENGEKALEQCEQIHPDVIIMDLFLPDIDGVAATEQIRQRWPETQVLILTGFPDGETIYKALQAGAAGCLLKTATAEQISQAIRAVYQRQTTLASDFKEKICPPGSHQRAHPTQPLSARELQVLELMAQGMNNPQIARRLIISTATAKFHVSSILEKFGVRSRTEAVALAVRTHLLDRNNSEKNHPDPQKASRS